MSDKIITNHDYPPIPVRMFDWSAHRDGYEPGDPIGTGATEDEAIADLLDAEAELSEETSRWTILIAYRARGSPMWSHHFCVEPRGWAAFYRYCRVNRRTSVYARVVRGEYVEVL